MTQQFSDDTQFAAFLRGAVQALPVPEPPRDAMWAAIAARRGHAHAVPQGAAVAVSPVNGLAQRQPTQQRLTVWARAIPVRFAVPLAAGFLIVGTGLGVVFGKRSVSGPVGQPSAQVAEGPMEPLPKALPAQLGAASHYESVGKLVSYFAVLPTADNAKDTETAENRQTRIVLSSLAMSLLSTTQVILDSPDLDETRLTLLRDIERILTQIVEQLSSEALPSDRQFIEQDIMNTQLMERLKTAAPVIQQGV